MRLISGSYCRSGRPRLRRRGPGARSSGEPAPSYVRVFVAILAALAFVGSVAGTAGATGTDLTFKARREARIRREGPILRTIRFVGNETFGRDELLPFMVLEESSFFRSVHFKRRLMERDLENLERFYMTQGFLSAEVGIEDEHISDDAQRIDVLIGVREGPRWRVGDVTFEGNRVLSDDRLVGLTTLRPDSPLLSNELEADRRAVLDAYARRSYLDARVIQAVSRDDETHTASIDYRILERERATIASVEIEGNEKTRTFVVEREFGFAPGDSFDAETIGETQAKIYRTGLFHSVWIEPERADSLKAEKRLNVTVSERPSGHVDFKVGYAVLDGPEAGVGFTNRNVQGQAITMGVEGRISEFDRGGRVSVGDPWFTGRPVAIDGSASYSWNDEESYVAETTGAACVFSKRFGPALTAESGYEFDRTVVLETTGSLEGEGTNYTSNIFAAASHDTRDDMLSARRGMLARARVDLASSRLGGTNDFGRYEIAWSGFQKMGHGRVGALSLRLGWMKPHGDGADIPVNERFFAGGDGSVRGFERNSLSPVDGAGNPEGGRALVVTRLEVRFPIWKKLRGAAFADAGQVFDDLRAVRPVDLAVGAGGGVRYETRVGVLRFDVATPISEKGSPEYYFGVGQAF